MVAGDDGSPIIEYSVKEILGRIETAQTQGFATVNTKLDTKADKGDLAAVHVRIDHVEGRLTPLEEFHRSINQTASDAAQRFSRRQWVLGLLVTLLAGGVGTTIGLLVR